MLTQKEASFDACAIDCILDREKAKTMSRYSRPPNSSLYVRNVPDGTR